MTRDATKVTRPFSDRYDPREWPLTLDEAAASTGLSAAAVLAKAVHGRLTPVARGELFWRGEWQGLRFEAVDGTRIAKFQIQPPLVRLRLPSAQWGQRYPAWGDLARDGASLDIEHAEAVDVHGDTKWIVSSGPKGARVEDRFSVMTWGPGPLHGPVRITRDDLMFLRYQVKRLVPDEVVKAPDEPVKVQSPPEAVGWHVDAWIAARQLVPTNEDFGSLEDPNQLQLCQTMEARRLVGRPKNAGRPTAEALRKPLRKLIEKWPLWNDEPPRKKPRRRTSARG